jgi:alanine transaminase
LEKSLAEARKANVDVRALAVINPGNPTGQCLSLESMQKIVQFCYKNSIVLLADEVYQENSYYTPFHSFKKVTMQTPGADKNLELISFHSVSKGVIGECGRRGGYMELLNIDPAVVDQIYKKASISLCSNINGQIAVGLMLNPPQPGDLSHPQWQSETSTIFNSLKRRAEKLVKAFNELEGVTCNVAQGAMYTFGRIRLPPKAIAKANAEKMAPDAYYCMKLLESTGVCVVPGSGFKQKEGTFHFRCTFLPAEDQFDIFLKDIKKFHADFMAENR